jgi:putative ABC transport system ATP-binding protein
MITTQSLTKTFDSGSGVVTALKDISISIPEGSFAAIVGKSGSGKSTLLALLGGLDVPTSGSIDIGGEQITKQSDRKLISYRRHTVGFIFQHYNLIPNISALENVMLPMEFSRVPVALRRERAAMLLAKVGLSADKQQRLPSRLSGGEQQRVSIARALANKPRLILADEPTGNLDSATSKQIVELLRALTREEKTTIIVVTHDLNITKHTDMTLQLKDGHLINRGGSVNELLH